MKLEPNLWFDEVVKTYHLISPHIHHTQLVTCPDLNEELGGRYLFKPESLQITGSFKVRGALSAISRLSKDELKRGVIAYSSGNHAQGVSLAANKLGIRSVIREEELTSCKEILGSIRNR